MPRVAYESREAGEVRAFDDDLFHIDLLNLKNFFAFTNYIYFSSKLFFIFFRTYISGSANQRPEGLLDVGSHVTIPKRKVTGAFLIETETESPNLTGGLVGNDHQDGRHDEKFEREHLGDK